MAPIFKKSARAKERVRLGFEEKKTFSINSFDPRVRLIQAAKRQRNLSLFRAHASLQNPSATGSGDFENHSGDLMFDPSKFPQ
jgi:hypothetical protein